MLKLTAIALLSAAAFLHVTEAHAAPINMDTVEGLSAAMSQSMYSCEEYLGADHFPNVEVLSPLANKSADGNEIMDTNYSQPYQKLIQQCSMQAMAWARQHPTVDNWGADEYLDQYAGDTKAELRRAANYTKSLLKDAAQAEAGKKVAQEAIRQEQMQAKATPAGGKVYTIIDIMQDPILKDQLAQCESTGDIPYMKSNARETYRNMTAVYNDVMRQYTSAGMSYTDAHREARPYLDEANDYIKRATADVKALANDCTVENFGWKQK